MSKRPSRDWIEEIVGRDLREEVVSEGVLRGKFREWE